MYCSSDHTIIKIEKFDITDNNTRYGQKFQKALIGKSYTEAKAMILAYTHCPACEISTYYSTDSWVKEMYVRGAHSIMVVCFNKATRKVQNVF